MDYQKTFSFVRFPDWNIMAIPAFGEDYETVLQDEFLMSCKSELNAMKSRLNRYEITDWNQHTTRMDPASKVVRTVTSIIRPKPFCSNAWCKFYEILTTLRLLDTIDLTSPLHSVHLCEAPGGFVCALNHKINTDWRGLEHQWLANTLNPYHEKCKLGEMIPDDRLIRHTLDRWLFGEDNTGDVTKRHNMDNIIKEAKKVLGSKIHLVTADGSFDCQLSPAEQEMVVYPLIVSEVFTAISLLGKGGVAVVKMFTMFELHTISLMYILNMLFDKVQVHKPATSRPGNSEVYVICIGRVDVVPEPIVSTLQNSLETGLPLLSLSDLPDSFVEQARRAAKVFKDWQMETIHWNISTYENRNLVPNRGKDNDECAREFIEEMRLQPISEEYSVTHDSTYRKSYYNRKEELLINSYGNESSSLLWQPRKRRLSGNFSKRLLSTAEHRLQELSISEPHPTQIVKFLYTTETSCPSTHSPVDVMSSLHLVTVPKSTLSASSEGRIYNSCFCEGKLLTDYNILADKHSDIFSQRVLFDNLQPITEFVHGKLSEFHPIIHLTSEEDTLHSSADTHRLIVVGETMEKDLATLLTIFKVLRTDDSLLLHNINSLSRLGAGVIFLLWHCFDEVAVAGHNAVSNLPSVLFKRCIMSPNESKECVRLLDEQVNSVITMETTILAFLPTPLIIQCTNLHSIFLCDINNELLRRSVNTLISVAKTSTQQSTEMGNK